MTAEILTLARSEEGCDKEILVRKMERLGVPVTRSTRVRRAEDSFAKALSRALESSDIVLLSGGLRDGFAADMLCRGLGLSARVHREGLLLLARARRKNPEKLPEEDLRRVHIPREAKGFCNPVTLCSAFVLQAGDQCILALPEDEESLEAVWENGAGAYLKGFLGQNGAPAPAEEAQSGGASAGAKESPAKEDREENAALPSGMQREKRTGFWGRMLPRRGDPPREKVRKGVFLLCVLVFLSSAGYLASYYWQAHANREQTKELEELYAQGSAEQLPAGYPADYLPKFAALWEVNPDLAGWLSIEGTQLSYPAVQTRDNDYYLRRDFLQKHNKHGIPMVDYRVGLKEPSDNIVIYGHNMKDGQMFGELLGYRDLDFYREHPVITFDSVYREAQYKIISVFITNAYEAQGPVFDYHNFIDAYGDSRTFGEFIQGVRVRSLINTPVDVQQGDKLLTLSTCDYSFKDSRFVVVARQLRPGESADVAVEQAQVNPNPVMPQAYYQGEGEAPVSPPYEEPESSESSSGSSSEESASSEESSESSSESSSGSSSEESSSVPESSVSSESSSLPPSSASSESSSESSSEESSSSVPESSESSSESSSEEGSSRPEEGDEPDFDGTFTLNGDEMDAYEAVCRVVQAEMGSSPEEALKAQAVATYTWLYKTNAEGRPPSGITTRTPTTAVKNAVADVWGELLCYGGKPMEIFYFSISNGSTQGAEDVWGTAIPGYEAVDSSWDENVTAHYKRTVSMTQKKVISQVWDKLGIDLEDVPVDEWFEVDSYTSGGYNGRMTVGGYSKVQSTDSSAIRKGAYITGRMLRENVLGLRSAAFEYEESGDNILFTTFGYGHGVGMSQHGAIEMAKEGYDYIDILEHYYVGARVE